MRKQFDIIVYDSGSGKPSVEGPALGWFFVQNISEAIPALNAEWVLIAHPDTRIDRALLDAVADATLEFPFADGFTPWIAEDSDPDKVIDSGMLLRKGIGAVLEFTGNFQRHYLRLIAAPSPYLAIFSKRLLACTGGFDPTFRSGKARFFDLGLRALHAGAKLYSLPGKPATAIPFKESLNTKEIQNEIAAVIYKNLGLNDLYSYVWRHPGVIPYLVRNRKRLDAESLRITELSRFSEKQKESFYI
ncbi:MAG: hypothetical protein M0P13_07265 [Fibrobacteraceae bacterium]|nr:hypothetical protein [Fibrobacteraceae bacterium]